MLRSKKLSLIRLILFILLISSVGQLQASPEAVFEDYLFQNNDLGFREGKRTDAVLVIKNSHVIYEKYARGYDSSKKHILWSVSKTITALLYGVAVYEKRINLEQPICDFIKTPRDEHCKIKLRDLLSWTTGIRWLEEYEGSAEPTNSSVIAMLYGEGRSNMSAFVLNQPMVMSSQPGQIWRYSSGDTMLAMKVLTGIFKKNDLRQVFQEKIFQPLKITNWTCETDGEGLLAGAYYFYLTAPDLAKIGELLLQGGRWGGNRIISNEFVQYMLTTPQAFMNNRVDHKDLQIPGSSLWLNRPGQTKLSSPWPGAPEDAYAGMGHWGQYLLVIPSLNTVAVRMGDTRDQSIRINSFAEHVTQFVKGGDSRAKQKR